MPNSLMYGSGTGSYAQTGYLLDASYIKLKQVILGYTFSRALINKIGLEKLRLNFSRLIICLLFRICPSIMMLTISPMRILRNGHSA